MQACLKNDDYNSNNDNNNNQYLLTVYQTPSMVLSYFHTVTTLWVGTVMAILQKLGNSLVKVTCY